MFERFASWVDHTIILVGTGYDEVTYATPGVAAELIHAFDELPGAVAPTLPGRITLEEQD